MKNIGSCPNCHKDFVVDSSLSAQKCPYCGRSFKTDEIPLYKDSVKEVKTDGNNFNKYDNSDYTKPVKIDNVPPETKKPSHGGIITFIVIILIIISSCFIIKSIFGGLALNLTQRNLTSSDYSKSETQGLTSYKLTIVPKISIKSIEVSATVFNSSNQGLYSDSQSKTDLTKSFSYVFDFDFGFEVALTAYRIEYTITGVVNLI